MNRKKIDERYQSKSFKDLKELFREMYSKRSLNPILGDIYAYCFYSKEPLSFSELSHLTGYSVPSISLALKIQLPMFHIIKKPSDRKKYVTVEKNPLSIFKKDFTGKIYDYFDNFLTKMEYIAQEEKDNEIKNYLLNMRSEYEIIRQIILKFKDEFENALNSLYKKNE